MNRDIWTYESCKEVALSCRKKQQLQEKAPGAFSAIYRNKWFDLYTHMSKGYDILWTYEKCLELALTCKTKIKFQNTYESAYNTACSKRWLEDIYVVMQPIKDIYWVYDKCKEVALTCRTRKDLHIKYGGAYAAINKNGWDELYSHMDFGRNIKWTYEKCIEIALSCETRKEFREKYPSAFVKIYTMGWSDDIFSHMKVPDLIIERVVYAFEFTDKSVYVGLTADLNKREKQHIQSAGSAVYQHIQKTQEYPIKKLISDGYILVSDAQILEGTTVELYRSNGWNILNKAKTGAIGGSQIKWTKEKCAEIAFKCKSRGEFIKKYGTPYYTALRKGWLDDICSHMVSKIKPNGYWTNITCNEESKKCINSKELRNKCSTAYNNAIKYKWELEYKTI